MMDILNHHMRKMVIAIIDYSPLWGTMKEKGVTQYKILKDGVLDNKTLDAIKKGNNMTLLTLERLCKYLNCTPNDIVRFVDEGCDKAKGTNQDTGGRQ